VSFLAPRTKESIVLKKLRAALGNALTWAASWGVWGILLSSVSAVLAGHLPWPFNWPLIGGLAVFGFLGGFTFSALLGLVYRKSTLPELRPLRMGVLGVLSGLYIPLCIVGGLFVGGQNWFGPAAAAWALAFIGVPAVATAVGSVKLAQLASKELEAAEPDRRPLLSE
jgi:hypothetical protein